MEDALVQNIEEKQKKSLRKSLNPCFNGRCTSTGKEECYREFD